MKNEAGSSVEFYYFCRSKQSDWKFERQIYRQIYNRQKTDFQSTDTNIRLKSTMFLPKFLETSLLICSLNKTDWEAKGVRCWIWHCWPYMHSEWTIHERSVLLRSQFWSGFVGWNSRVWTTWVLEQFWEIANVKFLDTFFLYQPVNMILRKS